jgi:hypothetical protein
VRLQRLRRASLSEVPHGVSEACGGGWQVSEVERLRGEAI